jgi:YggT family protein
MLHFIFTALNGLLSLFSLLIFIRILLSWFSQGSFNLGRPYQILCRVTDPYLNFFRRFSVFRLGYIDLSPIVALAVLSVANEIFSMLARFGKITIGVILALCLSALWSAIFFIIGFFIVILVIRLVAYLARINIYSPFWQIIDGISKAIQYWITGFLFRKRILNYRTSLLLSISILVMLTVALHFAVVVAQKFLIALPV